MTTFAVIGLDRDGALKTRRAAREAHLAYLAGFPEGFVRMAGPFLDDEGAMCGSLLIVEAPDRAAVDAFVAGDPYAAAGLFRSVEVRPLRITIPWR